VPGVQVLSDAPETVGNTKFQRLLFYPKIKFSLHFPSKVLDEELFNIKSLSLNSFWYDTIIKKKGEGEICK